MRKTINTEQFPELVYSVFGTGIPVVLLHGFPFDRHMWNNIVPQLSETLKVIVPDLPGAGESTFKGVSLSIEDMAASVKIILDNEGIDTAVVAGHSMGGYVAVAFAELYPETISGLGFIHSFASPDSEEKKDTRRKAIELFEKGGKDHFIRQMIPGLFAEGNKTPLKKEIDELTGRALLTTDKSMIAFYNAMINRPGRMSILKGNSLPVLWVIGAEDNIATPENLIQQSTLANVNFVYVYGDCGHMSMYENPGELGARIKEFVLYARGE